jgi:type II secretory ATPase GspE/PulE/Tfp pilus assembly ATPase PilB-like protein
MKIEPYLIASTVNIAIGQRLVRRLCSVCKKENTLSVGEATSLSQYLAPHTIAPGTKVWVSVGCSACSHTGYSGRIGIHEVLVLTPGIREAIIARASAEVLRTLAISEGMSPLIQDGLQKALAGITTVEEVLKIHYE